MRVMVRKEPLASHSPLVGEHARLFGARREVNFATSLLLEPSSLSLPHKGGEESKRQVLS
jgi:hypothetical protein